MMACSSEKKEGRKETVKSTETQESTVASSYHDVLTIDTSNLIDYISPDLLIDSTLVPTDKELQNQHFDFELYDRLVDYQLHERQLIGAVIEFRSFKNADSIMKGIGNHLKKHQGTLYESESFQNWVLPVNGRSLLEINVFPSDTLITVDINRRQHV